MLRLGGHAQEDGRTDGTPAAKPDSSADDEQLRIVLENQRQLGAAIGLLAHRFGCSTDKAWLLLVRLSQNSNVKVRVVAQILVEAFDGRPRPEDAPLRALLASQLPPMDWPGFAPGRAANDD